MARMYSDTDFYVAAPEPPESRRPPRTSVGWLGWLRHNLFSSALNSAITVVTAVLTILFAWEFLRWSMRSAQWGIVFNNLRLITSGQYDKGEIWRVELTAGILVFLIGLSMGLWGRITRTFSAVVLVILAFMLLIPLVGSQIPDPSVYHLIQPRKSPTDVIFLGYEGDKVTFTVDPLTDVADADQTFAGYQESASRTDWSTRAREVKDNVGKVDDPAMKPENYNLALTLRLLEESGAVLEHDGHPAELILAAGKGGTLSLTLPDDGWYVLEVVRDDEINDENLGFAWLKIDGVTVLSNLESDTKARDEKYGSPPKRERAILVQDKNYRFEGTRTLGEFVSVQVLPLVRRIVLPAVVGVVLFANAFLIGRLGKREKRLKRVSLAAWALSFPIILFILYGVSGSSVLPVVPTSVWGGLLLTILLTVVGIGASFPLGILLALGRRSHLPAVKWICTLFIEVLRGVPLITILFMAKLIVPFFWAPLSDLDLTVRMMIGLTLFTAAYLAENIRGGLQIVPQGQVEAARALGMSSVLITALIVLPQALRAVIPAIVGQFISLFKDTSLVALVGLFELAGIVDLIVSGSNVYRPYQREAYIFIAIIYFMISYGMSDISRRLETSGAGSIRRSM